ncbi:MAG: Mut7-C RNAse domain-containing protein [Elusimicrobiota bacterium]|nr:Mut7-C RNAse domain-containing protein [Elusimicrobiota bacterium]
MNRKKYNKDNKKFLVDYMLGRLCRWMRILGIDTAYHRPEDNLNIVYRSLKEKRVIITRNLKLKNSPVFGIFIIDTDSYRQQLKEFLNKFNITINPEKLFTRCPDCNGELASIKKKEVKEKVPDYVYKTRKVFSICPDCRKLYWKGTHKELIDRFLNKLL